MLAVYRFFAWGTPAFQIAEELWMLWKDCMQKEAGSRVCVCVYSVGIWKWQGRSSGKKCRVCTSILFDFWQRKLINPKWEAWDLPFNIPKNKSLHVIIFFYSRNVWMILDVVHPILFYNEDKERQFLDQKHHNSPISSTSKAHVLLFEMFIWHPPVLMWKCGFLSVWFEMVMLFFAMRNSFRIIENTLP